MKRVEMNRSLAVKMIAAGIVVGTLGLAGGAQAQTYLLTNVPIRSYSPVANRCIEIAFTPPAAGLSYNAKLSECDVTNGYQRFDIVNSSGQIATAPEFAAGGIFYIRIPGSGDYFTTSGTAVFGFSHTLNASKFTTSSASMSRGNISFGTPGNPATTPFVMAAYPAGYSFSWGALGVAVWTWGF